MRAGCVRVREMIITNDEVLDEFTNRYRNATDVFARWKTSVEGSAWTTPLEAQQTMTGVRSLGHGRLVFNIGGTNYRLVADVDYVMKELIIRFIGTHAQYDRILKTGGFRPWR